MKRTGFARPDYKSPSEPGRLTRLPNYSVEPYSGGGRPKEPRQECPHLLLMARRPRQVCLLQIPGVCPGGERDDCCAAHGNSLSFNKAGGMKAHDFVTVRACARCHAWLDSSYDASYEEKQLAFKAGYVRQVAEWHGALFAPSTVGADWKAIDWALRWSATVRFPV